MQQDTKEQLKVEIPNDPEQTVLLWDLTGGFRAPLPPGFKQKPKLQIFADGRVVSGSNGPQFLNGEMKLERSELQQLLEFVVNEHNFFESSQADIQRMLEGYQSRLADGLTTVLNVDAANQQQQIEVYALFDTARAFPDSDAFKNLLAIEKRLRQIKVMADAGGKKAIEAMVAAANEQLKREVPDMPPFTMSQLSSATRFANGKLTARMFQRKDDVSVNAELIQENPEAEYQVKLTIRK